MNRKVKAVLIGDSGVGKSCIFAQYESGSYHAGIPSTVGGAYTTIKTTTQAGEVIDVGLWDTAGQERFRNVVPMYFERAHFVIVVFSLTEVDSFKNCQEWVQLAQERASQTSKLILIGNKCDLVDEREVTTEELIEYGESIGAILSIETSAKTGAGLDALVQEMANNMALVEVNRAETESVLIPSGSKKKSKCCK